MRRFVVLGLLLGLLLGLSLFKKQKRGTFLGIPYNVEAPTPARVRQAIWNPNSSSVMAPHVFGWGYSVNLHAVARKLGLV